jgi:hypothetical protein
LILENSSPAFGAGVSQETQPVNQRNLRFRTRICLWRPNYRTDLLEEEVLNPRLNAMGPERQR